jgi:hypothetical protein
MSHLRAKIMRILQAIFLLALFTGCSLVQEVKPWEKGVLAKSEMVFDEDVLDALYIEHTYSSKEAAFGGAGIGGGGCGCN